MSSDSVILFARIAGPLVASTLAYQFWRCINAHRASDLSLFLSYIASRLGLWIVFAVFMQDYVTNSDPKLFYTPMLEHLVGGEVPIRDFFYPYGPFLILSMLPTYLLLGHSLAGISLFSIAAEALAIFFFLKCTSLLEDKGELDRSWVRQALAVYLLNPATLYWTVFHGYNSIVQTAYAMGACYFLLRRHLTMGYAIGLYSLAGSKFLAVLDWPALLSVCRPRFMKLFLGAIPLFLTYMAYQMITGDILFPIRYHINHKSEGNVWYLITLFGDSREFYSSFPGNLLPVVCFGIVFLLGSAYWLKYVRLGLTSFSFQAAMGVSTFAMSLFFLFSFYTGNYYIPMLMLPASLVVTSPVLLSTRGIWSLLLLSGLSVAGNAIWSSLGQPDLLMPLFSSSSLGERLSAVILTATVITRIGCLGMLAQLGMVVALNSPIRRAQPGG